MASTPSSLARWVSSIECAVSFEPVPAITVLPPDSATASSNSRSFSSSVRVAPSPVLPATTTPSGAVLEQVVEQVDEGRFVDAAIRVERRDDRGEDAGDHSIGL